MNSDIKKIASLDIQILILVLYSLSFTNTKCDRNGQIQQNVRQAIAILEGREREIKKKSGKKCIGGDL